MSILNLFNIGKSAMAASQTALSLTSHNIANVNTPGFSRQEAIFNISSPVALGGGLIGMGVTVSGIKRSYDSFIQNQLLLQQQNYGKTSAQSQVLSQVEQIFNETKDMGLSASLTDYFNAWHEVASNPEGQPPRTVLLQKANTLILTAKRMEQGILDNLRQTGEDINDIVNRINSIASDIAALNGKIARVEAGQESENANDFRDKRDNLLKELSNLVEFSSYEERNGSVTVMIDMRNLVCGEKTNLLSTQPNEDGENELYLDGINITDNITKGRLGGVITVRDDIETNLLSNLRKLIASLTKDVNILHSTGYGLDGTTGNNFFIPLQLFTKDFSSGANMTATITNLSQLTLDEYNIQFDAASNYYVYNKQTGALITSGAYISGNPIAFDGIELVITGAINPADKFFVSPLTDAIKNFGTAITDYKKVAAAASDTTLPGDNTNALNIASLSDISIANLSGSTFASYYSSLVLNIGSLSRSASDSLEFDENLLSEIENRRQSISGVSLDEEAANLIRFQRSFEAGARMIKVTDELLETILNL